MNNSTTQFWKDETINQANALAEREAIYKRGFGDGHKEAREYTKKLIKDEIWTEHKLTDNFGMTFEQSKK